VGDPWDYEEELAHQVLAWAEDRLRQDPNPFTGARPRDELEAEAGQTITEDGLGFDEAFRVFTDVLAPATRAQDHPLNLAYIPNAPTEAARLMDVAVSVSSIFGGAWEAGAGAIFAENQALDWLRQLAGLPEGAGGTFVSGATIGTLSALAAARGSAGPRPPGGWRIAATAEAHASVRSDARVLDVGVLDVPGDERSRLTGPNLAAALEGEDGVFAVVASAGTTNAGVVDDLAGVADVCARHGLWLHVDGAYGGAALAAPSVRERLAGIERADSIVIDPHKWLFANYDCAALLYRDPAKAAAVHAQHADYLDTVDRQMWNPTDYAVHLTRRARGLPFWFSLAVHGAAAYREAIEASLTLARQVAAEVDARPYLELALEPELSVVVLRRVGWSAEQYSTWSAHHAAAGTWLVLPTRWQGQPALRLCFLHPRTQLDDIVELLDSLGPEATLPG
jgi:glutamate/tyrosine decarboxylase-like PLP-dependent enzyme